MAVLLDPIVSGPGLPGDLPSICDDNYAIVPTEPTANGCPVLVKRRSLQVQQGVPTRVLWPMRDPNGNPVNLSGCFGSSSQSISGESASLSETDEGNRIVVRWSGCTGPQYWEVEATVVDATYGTISFDIPSEVLDVAGIYSQQIAIIGADGQPKYVEPGLISVERTLWAPDAIRGQGPPTIQEIRISLRDFPAENELLNDYEWSVEEILQSIVDPVRQWNETPPLVRRYNCATFPYIFHWKKAIVTELLHIAILNLSRNQLRMSHGGLQGSLKGRYEDYMRFITGYKEEWMTFMAAEKGRINAQLAFGQIGSDYVW